MYHRRQGNIQVFDTEYFEAQLPKRKSTGKPLWEKTMHKGEVCYLIDFDDPSGVRIYVRSSIDASGLSGATGQDSIRLYLMGPDGTPLNSKLQRWLTRRPGWEDRLWDQFSILRQMRRVAGDCCKRPRLILKAKRGPTAGSTFAKCTICGKTQTLNIDTD